MADLTFMHCASNIFPADISVGLLRPLQSPGQSECHHMYGHVLRVIACIEIYASWGGGDGEYRVHAKSIMRFVIAMWKFFVEIRMTPQLKKAG